MTIATKTNTNLVLKNIGDLFKAKTLKGRYVYPDSHFDVMGMDGELFDISSIRTVDYNNNNEYDIGDIF